MEQFRSIEEPQANGTEALALSHHLLADSYALHQSAGPPRHHHASQPGDETAHHLEPSKPHQPSKSLHGIDVSDNNGHINWREAKAAHVDFVVIKATEGATFKDRDFQENWNGSRHAGIVHGAYHYFRPDRSVSEQVKDFVGTVKHVRPGDMAPVLDLEQPGKRDLWHWGHDAKANADKVLAWLKGVKRQLGVTPILYMSPSLGNHVLGNDRRLARYPLFLAQYHTPKPDVPAPFGKYTIWQYTRHGHVSGVARHVDRDLFNGTWSQFDRLRKR